MTMNTNSEEDFQGRFFFLTVEKIWIIGESNITLSQQAQQANSRLICEMELNFIFKLTKKNALRNSQRVATILIIVTSDVN